uniref:TOG domain-containing protein n=1 Tax=Plectus sambesii TaxID=2011161 RepID=A0A914WNZ6_9BILA
MRPPAIVNGSYQAPYPAKGNLQPIGFSFHRSSSVGQPPVQTLELSNPLYDEQTLMKRTQSDGHLLAKATDHDRFDNWDDAPIKPAKSGSYLNGVSSQLPPSPRKLNLFHKKSISNTNVNQFSAPSPPIKQSNSAGSHKKPHNFLQRGASQKKPPPAPPAKPPSKMLDVPKNPAQALQFALQKISSEEWTDKVDGINLIQQLSETSPQTVVSDLHTVSTALNTECKNLRSSVSRQALTCYGQLCLNLKTKMDPEIEKACQVLMAKSGDVSSAFIREDAFQSLEHMVDHTSNCKVVPALIASGASSKTITIRSGCGQLLARLVENIGATKALNQKEVCDKIIPQSLVFVQDTQPSVRYYGKYILQLLNQDAANFDRNCKRLLSDGQMRTVKDVLTTIKNKGLGDAPANGAAPSANPTPLSNTLVRNGSVKRNAAPLRKLADSVQLDLDEIYADLSSGNWETRLTGLDRYKEMCAHNIKAVASDTRLVEAFIARLNDINGKVAAQAMETHQRTLPLMGQQFSSEAGLKAVMDQMIKALMAHLPSKNDELRYLGQSSIDATMTHIDHSCLIAPFATATKTANIKQKPFMLSMLSRLSQSVYKTKPKQVEVNTLPVLWDLMKTQSGDNAVKAALSDFSKSLARTMGKKTLLESSTGSLNSTQKADLDAIIS